MTETSISEANLEKMQARMHELVGKDALTPAELKEFVYLLWDTESDYSGLYGISWWRVGKVEEQIGIFLGQPSHDSAEITFLDNFSEDSGEIVLLVNNFGQLDWYIGVRDSYYSEFLGRKIAVEHTKHDFVSKYPLAPKELAKVAKTVWEAYQEGKNSQE